MSLPVISLWEPWASLMAHELKRIETRGWETSYRGPVAIHATASGMTHRETFETCSREPFLSALKGVKVLRAAMSPRQVYHAFPRGHIIAVGNLCDCARSEAYRCAPGVFDEYRELDTPQERAFGNYEPGRFGFVFDKMFRLLAPVPFKSRQGKLIELDPVTEALVREQWRGF